MSETKPLQLATMLSIAYSDFMADFREVRTSEGFLSIADLGMRPAKPNKANVAKAFVINIITEKSEKQTQWPYPAFYQLLAAILGAILSKFGWKRGTSLSRIRAHGQGLSRRGFQNRQLATDLSCNRAGGDLYCARYHTSTVFSVEAARYCPLGANATVRTGSLLSLSVWTSWPVSTFQTRTVLSSPAEASHWPSAENSAQWTAATKTEFVAVRKVA